MGGEMTDFDFDFDTRAQSVPFAFLKKEAEKAKPKEEPDYSDGRSRVADRTNDLPLMGRAAPPPAPSSAPSTYSRSEQSSQPGRSESSAVHEDASRKRNPFDRRALATKEPEVQSGGWAPGLQEKIANAQVEEGEAPEFSMSKSLAEPNLQGLTSFKSRVADFNAVSGRPCNDIFGFEKWYIFSKKMKASEGNWKHLFVRRYQVPIDYAPTLFSTIASAIATSKAVPRHLSIDNGPQMQFTSTSSIRIELGGWSEGEIPGEYLCDRFPRHKGISTNDAYAILHVQSILNMHEEVQARLPQSASKTNQRSRQQIEPAHETIALSRQPMEKAPASLSAMPGARDPIKLSASTSTQEQKVLPRREAPSISRNTQKHDGQTKESKWSTLYGREYGDPQREGDRASRKSSNKALLNTVLSHAPPKAQPERTAKDPWLWSSPGVRAKASSDSSASKAKEGATVKKVPEEAKSRAVENATPVLIDGEQAEGTAATSASDQTVNAAAQQQNRTDADMSTSRSPPESAPIEEVTPVKIDGEQASETTTSQEGKVIEEPGKSDSAENHPVEEATPVYVDGEQASDSATDVKIDAARQQDEGLRSDNSQSQSTPTSAGAPLEEATPFFIDQKQAGHPPKDQAVEAARKEQEGLRSDNSQDMSTSPSPSIEDSTPVLIDGDQASETATPPNEGSEKPGRPEEDRESTSIEQATPVHVDTEQANPIKSANKTSENKAEEASGEPDSSSSIEDSTPVRVDDEQAKGTAANTKDGEDSPASPTTEGRKPLSDLISEASHETSAPSQEAETNSDNRVDDSTPVIVDGEQVGKQ